MWQAGDYRGPVWVQGDAEAFQRCFIAWVGSLAKVGPDLVAVDGKTVISRQERPKADRVRFLGPRDDVHLILSAADLHVSASHTEGLPNNMLEAMAAGVAVVATDAGGTRDLVRDGITGQLVPPRNPLALAAALRLLVDEREYREGLGRNGLKHAERHFGIRAFLDAHAALYQRLMESPAPSFYAGPQYRTEGTRSALAMAPASIQPKARD